MMRKLLVVVRSGVNNQQIVEEALDAALVCAAFGMEVSLLFEGDGLKYLEEDRLPELLKHAAPGDFVRIMAQGQSSMVTSIEWLSADQVLASIQAHQELMVT